MSIKTKQKGKSRTIRKDKLEYITDKKGSKTKVVIPIQQYEELLEDLHDLAVVAERKSEGTISYDEVIKQLKRNGLL